MHITISKTARTGLAALTLAALVFSSIGLSFVSTVLVAHAATPVTVTITKFMDGVAATALNSNSQTFPMFATGSTGGDPLNTFGPDASYSLSPSGYPTDTPPNTAYQAQTGGIMTGDNYSTREDISGAVVGASCGGAQPYALVGYTTGDTFAQAQAATPTMTVPTFVGLTGDKYVIVWNQDCSAPTVSSVSPTSGTTAGGDTVTLMGTGFTGATTVDFGATPATGLTVVSDTSLTVTSPAHTAGMVDVVVTTPDGVTATSSADQFTFVAPPATTTVQVTINKYIDGVQATATSAGSNSFPMSATWNDMAGIGAGT
ncbi:MAG: IPT/TIG domain-containing protein, partial [Chthoniobacterales bacterium]